MNAMASQITGLSIVYPAFFSGADQRKYQSSASLAFVGPIHSWSVNYPHKGPVTRKMFLFDAVLMILVWFLFSFSHLNLVRWWETGSVWKAICGVPHANSEHCVFVSQLDYTVEQMVALLVIETPCRSLAALVCNKIYFFMNDFLVVAITVVNSASCVIEVINNYVSYAAVSVYHTDLILSISQCTCFRNTNLASCNLDVKFYIIVYCSEY